MIRAFAERKGLGDKVRPPALPSTPSGWVSLVGHESELGGNRLLCRNLGPFVMSLTLTYQPLAPADTAALGELMERIENEIALEHLAIIGSDESQQQLRLLGLGVNILRVAQGASWRIADTPNTTADVVVQTDPFGAPARISLRFDRPGICAAFLAMAEKRGWTRASGGTSWLPSPWNAPVLVEPNTEFASMRTCVETRTGALGVSYFGERIPTAEESPGIAFMLSTVYEAKHAGPTAAAATTTTVSSSVDRSRPPSSLGVFVGLGAAISSADTAPNRYPETMGFELLRRGVKPGKRVGLTIGGALEGGLDLPGLFFLAEGGSTRVGYTVDANVVAGLGVRLGRALLHPLAMLGYDAIKDIAPGEGYIGPALHGLVPVGLAYLARYAFASQTAFYLLLAFAFAVGVVVYWTAMDSCVDAAWKKREQLLNELSAGEGPVEMN